MRPTIDHLFDVSVLIWRRAVTLGPLREEVVSYAPLPPGPSPNAKLNRPKALQADTGPGLANVGERMIYMRPDVDVLERDLIQIVAGPDAPGLWEVDGPPTCPKDHHTELRCRVFNGPTPVAIGALAGTAAGSGGA